MKNRKLWLAFGLFAGVCFLLGFLVSFQLPKMKSWALMRIGQASDRHLPMKILPTSIEIDIFPLGATLHDVRIIPKMELNGRMAPMMISKVGLRISLLQLAHGRLKLREISIADTKAVIDIPKSKPSADKPLAGLFHVLSGIPVQRIRLESVDLSITNAEPSLAIDMSDVSLLAENQNNSLALEFASSRIRVRDPETEATVQIDVEAAILLQQAGVTISALKVRRGVSYLVASGLVQGDTEALDFNGYDFKTRGSLKLDSIRNWTVKTFPNLKMIPTLAGSAEFEASLHQSGKLDPEITFKIDTDKLGIDHFSIGTTAASGVYKNSILTIPRLEIRNQSGKAVFTDSRIEVNEILRVRTKADVASVEIHELLKDLGVGTIPVFLQVQGQMPCEGTLRPEIKITCTGALNGRKLLVKSDMESKNPIVALPEFSASGDVTIDEKAVEYSANLTMPNSKGRSQGRIDYKTGFKINYETPGLAIQDVENLSNLKLEGRAAIKGTTQGDSHSATLTLQLDGKDMWLEDYWLGNGRTRIEYKSGQLYFKDIEGHLGSSRYNGNVTLDLLKDQILVLGRIPFVDARDLLAAFKRRVELPMEVTGTGSAQIKVWGPLEFTALSYDLKSTLFRGMVSGESYDQAYFDVTARKGEVTADRVQILKGSSSISLTGKGYPNGKIKTLVTGRKLHLEETNLLSNGGLSVAGVVNFEMDLTGPVLKPDTELRGTVTRMSIGDQAVADSAVRMKFTANTIEGEGRLLGETMTANFAWPLNPNAPFRLDLETRNWDFAPVFSAIAGPGSRKDFDTLLSSKIHLSSPTGGFWNSTGSIGISKFLLKRGTALLSAPEPISLQMQGGQIKVDNAYLEGDNTFLRAVESPNPVNKLDLQVNGKLDLGLMALMLPFFEDLRGLLSFSFNVRGGPSTLELLGSAYVDRGYLKLFDFPHAFEEFRSDLLFSQKKVLINSLAGTLAGGRFHGDGTLELKGYKNLPLRLNALIDKVTLNIPTGVKTSGSGKLHFTGNWFPYHMSGTYNIRDGLITKEFAGETDQPNVRRNNFLPQLILEESFNPLTMDLQISMPRPVNIINSQIEGTLTGQLQVKGSPEKISILGNINAEKETKVFFRETAFDVTAGNIQFTDPKELNPILYLAARSRVSDYDVNLVLQGTAQKPVLNLSSQPPLSEESIISLLALGVTSEKLDTNVSSSEQAAQSINQVTSAILSSNPLGKEIKDRFGFDVQFSPGFDETNNVAVPKISVSRQFTPKLGVSGTRSIGKDTKTEAKVKYRVNNRVSLVGSWEGQEFAEDSDQAKQKDQNSFGLDLEYKIEFK